MAPQRCQLSVKSRFQCVSLDNTMQVFGACGYTEYISSEKLSGFLVFGSVRLKVLKQFNKMLGNQNQS